MKKALKAGFVSKDSEVSHWTLKTYELFANILDSYELEEIIWNWLSESQGIKSMFLCLKRHPEWQELIINLLITFTKHRLIELMNEKMQFLFPDEKDLFFVLSRILINFEENPLSKKIVLFNTHSFYKFSLRF